MPAALASRPMPDKAKEGQGKLRTVEVLHRTRTRTEQEQDKRTSALCWDRTLAGEANGKYIEKTRRENDWAELCKAPYNNKYKNDLVYWNQRSSGYYGAHRHTGQVTQ